MSCDQHLLMPALPFTSPARPVQHVRTVIRFPSASSDACLQVLPLVVQWLPMISQRATYIRAFLWAMPERCQQVAGGGALGVAWLNMGG